MFDDDRDNETLAQKHIREIAERDARWERERQNRALTDAEAARLRGWINERLVAEREIVFESVAENSSELRAELKALQEELATLRAEKKLAAEIDRHIARAFAAATDSTPLTLPNPLSLRTPKQ
jgi:hypothetical protein